MTRNEVAALLERRRDALERRDMRAFGALYAESAVLESPLASSATGPEAIVAATGAFLEAFPHATITEGAPVIDEGRAAIAAEVSGTHEGRFMGLAPTGRPFRFPVVFLFECDDDHIARERRVYDFTGLLVQIGVLKAKPV
jgi:steroid delta-isomerase-like uncharacterized protein